MKKVILILIILILAAIAGWYYLNGQPFQTGEYIDASKISMQTYTTTGEHTESGLLTIPFKKTLDQPVYINILLAGRWIVMNIPVEVDTNITPAYSFNISSLDVDNFDIDIALTKERIDGTAWVEGLNEIERIQKSVSLKIIETQARNCYESLATEGSLELASEQSSSVTYFPSLDSFIRTGGCIGLTEEMTVLSLPTDDQQLFTALQKQLRQSKEVVLLADNGSSKISLGLTALRVADDKLFMQVVDPSTPANIDTYRLENASLKSFATVKGDLPLKAVSLVK